MINIPPTTPERNPYPCRKCGQQIFWHKAASGKHYPCDSPTDRKAFHQCKAAQQAAKPVEKAPLTPSYFEPTLEERVTSLETQVSRLTTAVKAVEARQPITAEDVGI